MSDTTHNAFLGDRDRVFDLTPPLVVELERTTGAGIGTLVKRVVPGACHAKDLLETIRLSLIGGGETPENALTVVDTYVLHRPIAEAHELAAAILMTLWAGKKPAPAAEEPIA